MKQLEDIVNEYMKQHTDMVDILIYENKKALNMAPPLYIPEEKYEYYV